MSGIQRDKARIKATAEVFTPVKKVQQDLDKLDPSEFQDPTKTFLDPSAGDGAFLGEVLIRKLQNGIDFGTALSNIYGTEMQFDNVELCKERLLCKSTDPKHIEIVNRQIVCADTLKYHGRFDNTPPYDPSPGEKQDQHFNKLFG